MCPSCRNVAIDKPVRPVDGEDRAVAECPDCDHEFEFPYLPLAVLEGAPAVGKSTTAGHLGDRPSRTIYEGDLHIDLTADRPWAPICDLDFRVCTTLHPAGQRALFVGGVHPHDLADSPETRYSSRIDRCALVCDDDEYRARFGRRPAVDEEAVEEFLEGNRWYREQGPDEGIEVVSTSAFEPAAVADRIAAWLESTA